MSTKADELPEWKEGAKTARARRKQVAAQISDALQERDETGSRAVLARRLQELVSADREPDPIALRGAVFEVAISAGQWIVELDLERQRPR